MPKTAGSVIAKPNHASERICVDGSTSREWVRRFCRDEFFFFNLNPQSGSLRLRATRGITE